ncbi:hypothetical protein STEG23_020842 [Scotinomys teguina]
MPMVRDTSYKTRLQTATANRGQKEGEENVGEEGPFKKWELDSHRWHQNVELRLEIPIAGIEVVDLRLYCIHM